MNNNESYVNFWRNGKKGLDKHFLKHRNEFENITKAKYACLPLDLLEKSDKLILKKIDNNYEKIYDRVNNVFCVFNEGKIITCFKPKDREKYWDNQPGRKLCTAVQLVSYKTLIVKSPHHVETINQTITAQPSQNEPESGVVAERLRET